MAKIKKKASKTVASPEEEIRSLAHHVSDYYHAYQKQLNTVITVLVLALIVAVLYSFVRAGNEKKAGLALNTAYEAAAPAGGGVPNYPAALQRFQEVVKQYGGTLSGAIAQYSIGNTYLAMGQPEPVAQKLDKDQLLNLSETIPEGPSTAKLIEIADKNKITVLAGYSKNHCFS